jgi:hypothetical protein
MTQADFNLKIVEAHHDLSIQQQYTWRLTRQMCFSLLFLNIATIVFVAVKLW